MCSSIFRRSIDVPPPLPVGTRGRGRGKGGPKRGKRSRKARQQEEEQHLEEDRRRRKKSTRRRSCPSRSMCLRRLRRGVGARRARRRMTRQVVTLVVPFSSEVAHDSRIGRYLFRDDH
jgi:hypothetical protein